MRNRTLACAAHNLRRLTASPRNWALLILAVLCFDRYIAPIRALMVDEGITIGWPALMVFLLNDSWLTVLAGLGLLVLLFDLPMADEAQKYLLIRSGRGAWARGQIVYILLATAIYMLVLGVLVLLWILPWIDWTWGWSDTIMRFVDGAYEVYDSMLDYDPWLISSYSVLSAFGIQVALHFICFATLAVVMAFFNSLVGNRAGFLFAMGPLMADTVMTEFFGVHVWYFSPVTLTRLSCLDYGDGMMRPSVGYAFVFLTAWLVLFILSFLRLHRRKEIRL